MLLQIQRILLLLLPRPAIIPYETHRTRLPDRDTVRHFLSVLLTLPDEIFVAEFIVKLTLPRRLIQNIYALYNIGIIDPQYLVSLHQSGYERSHDSITFLILLCFLMGLIPEEMRISIDRCKKIKFSLSPNRLEHPR